MNRWIDKALQGIAAAGLCVALGLGAYAAGSIAVAVVAAEECHEDQPCWDCDTMGNQQCAPPLYSPDGSLVDRVETFYQDGWPAWTYTTYQDGTGWVVCHLDEQSCGQQQTVGG